MNNTPWFRARLVVYLCLLLLYGCVSSDPSLKLWNARIPAGTWLVFEGILPCADCRGIKTRLELFVDQNNPEPPFILKQEYIGANEGERTSVRSGMYGISVNTFRDAETAVFVLNPYERNNRMYFLHVSFDTIKLLNQQMGEIPSTMNHLLIRTETIREKQ